MNEDIKISRSRSREELQYRHCWTGSINKGTHKTIAAHIWGTLQRTFNHPGPLSLGGSWMDSTEEFTSLASAIQDSRINLKWVCNKLTQTNGSLEWEINANGRTKMLLRIYCLDPNRRTNVLLGIEYWSLPFSHGGAHRLLTDRICH